MLKIAHIAPDEKFIETAVDIFETTYPDQNTFYITSPKPWSYIKDKQIYRQLNKKKWLQMLISRCAELKDYDVVILHGLPSVFLIPMVLRKQKYIWLGWGYDYYSRPFDSELLDYSLVLSKTKEYTKTLLDNSTYTHRKISFVSAMMKSLVNNLICRKFFYKLAMRNLKVFSPVLPQEYDLVRQKYGLGKYTQYSPWNYGILERHIIKNMPLGEISTAHAILLGNSATETNNHFEALDVIVKSRTTRKIFIPLSYGDRNYANLVKEYIQSESILVSQCYVLDTFMPLEEYNTIINDCGFVIMNHVRQQALGNIVAMMFRGSKIFLREESILYSFFKDLDAHIYSVQELESDPSLLEYHLTNSQIEHNRRVLQETWSESVLLKRTKDLVETAIS